MTYWVSQVGFALTAFLEFVAINLVGIITLFGLLAWVRRKHPRWRDFAAFLVAAGAAYSASFALDMFVGALLKVYSFSPFAIPVFTWSGISVALHSLARMTANHQRWTAIPYFGFGVLAVIPGLLGPHRYDIVVGMPLILFGTFFVLSYANRERSSGQEQTHALRHNIATCDTQAGAFTNPRQCCILIVDDDEAVRDIISSMLTSEGYQCQAVQSGYDALAMLAAGEQFNLLLTDLVNCPMDGITLLERIKANFPHIPVVIVTAINDASVAIACARSGADEYIEHPVKRERLLAAVGRALRHQNEAS